MSIERPLSLPPELDFTLRCLKGDEDARQAAREAKMGIRQGIFQRGLEITKAFGRLRRTNKFKDNPGLAYKTFATPPIPTDESGSGLVLVRGGYFREDEYKPTTQLFVSLELHTGRAEVSKRKELFRLSGKIDVNRNMIVNEPNKCNGRKLRDRYQIERYEEALILRLFDNMGEYLEAKPSSVQEGVVFQFVKFGLGPDNRGGEDFGRPAGEVVAFRGA